MRALCPLILLCTPLWAQDPFATTLKVFEDTVKGAFEPGAKSSVFPSVEAMFESRDARAAAPLARFLVGTLDAQAELIEGARRIQRDGSAALERSGDLQRELTVLRVREKAGATDVGPAIAEREAALRREEETFRGVRVEISRIDRTISYAAELREKLCLGLGALLADLDPQDAGAAMGEVRRILDVSNADQALFLVRILRGSGKREAGPHLLEVLQHPKATVATRRLAIAALGPIVGRAGAEAMLRAAETDLEGLAPHVLHALGLAAQRPLENLEEARAWAATLPEAR